MIHDIWTNAQHHLCIKKKSIFKTVEFFQGFLPGTSWGGNATLQPPTQGSLQEELGAEAPEC